MSFAKYIPLNTIKSNISVNTNDAECKLASGNTSESGSPSSSYHSYQRTDEEGVTLVWHNICVYALANKSNRNRNLKRIINNVSGVVQPGTLVALMGASGSGKTTLMSSLAYRNCANTIVQGDILLNGRPVAPFMHKLSGFVHQEDLFIGVLTVMEQITFMANLKLDTRTPKHEKSQLINSLLEKVGLKHCANTRIGSDAEKKVLSGGEKKRLAFATELITNPVILFCDEPTTGLDSYSAQQIVSTLENLARRGTSVICTIHQPSSQLFAMFDKVLLLAEGRVAFMGQPTKALEFFASQGYVCPQSYNPADFLIGILATPPGCEKKSERIVQRLCNLYSVSEEWQQMEIVLNNERQLAELPDDRFSKLKMITNFKPPTWYYIIFNLVHRTILTVVRDPQIQTLRIIQKLAIALMAGLCFLGAINLDQKGIQAVQGALFIIIAENSFNPMYSVLAYFPSAFPLFLREKRSGIYTPIQYYIANIIGMLPGLIIEPTLFSILGYWLIGLRPTMFAFLATTLLTTLVMNVSTACGCLFSTAFNSVPFAMAYLVPFDCILLFTSGVFVKLNSLPFYIGWTKYMSWLMYANEAMSIIQWEGVMNITCPIVNGTELPCLSSGAEILEQYSFSFDNFYRDFWAIIGLYFLFHVLAYFFLWKRSKM